MSATRWDDFRQEYPWDRQENIPDWFFNSSDAFDHLTEIFQNNRDSNEQERLADFPEIVPILPLRGVVVYPQTAVPLTIGQPRSIRLVDDVAAGEKYIGLITSKESEIENPSPEHLYSIGTLGIIHRLFRAPDGTIRLLVQGIARFRTREFVSDEPYLTAQIEMLPDQEETGLEIEALARNARDQFVHIAELIPSIPREIATSVGAIEDPLQTVYTISNFQRMDLNDAQQILQLDPPSNKLHRLVSILAHEIELLELGQKIQNQARSEIDKVQKEYFLREQLKALQRELGENDDQTVEVEEFRKKIGISKMSPEAEKLAQRELDRLSRLSSSSAEYGVIRNYLDWLTSLPWSTSTPDNLDIPHARTILDSDHYGLEDIKQRILEFLAVRRLREERRSEIQNTPEEDVIRRDREGAILCFIGPPGVGKTSLGRSIAHALERKFVRISLGGVRDEAEIRGHRRTYIGAMPGRILQAMRRLESNNPVFMLDEIDKLRTDFSGDPASALLEVLDPEQNYEFRDHYLEVAFDLSQVMFITTANQMETIPGPLLDRMEIIQLSGYTEREKMAIARQYLLPRQVRENGLRPDEITFQDDALQKVIREYTREAGVRNLEREIGAILRKGITQMSEGMQAPIDVTMDKVSDYLGRPKFLETEEITERLALPGVATGLAWTPYGGDILFIEATRMPGSKGFQVTGSIGKIMQESAQAALSFVRANSQTLTIDPELFNRYDIHLHIPAGATPKDGPSAGVTIITALVSLMIQAPVDPKIGMTGEISLTGQVLPVGGIKEKILAAHRAGLKTIILPRRNEMDLEDIPQEIRQSIEFVFANHVSDVLRVVFSFPETAEEMMEKEHGKTAI